MLGCEDDWNSLDHFDPTMDTRGNHTDQVWMLFSNENLTTTWAFDCTSPDWIPSPYPAPVTVRNLCSPYETYVLQNLLSLYNNDSKAPFFGCLPAVTHDPFGFKALVPEAEWVAPLPAITKFLPGHDVRIQAESGDTNATSLDVTLEVNVPMDCDTVAAAISFNMSSSGHGGSPSIGTPKCGNVTNPDPASVANADISQFSWSTTLTNVPDSILTITVTNPTAQTGVVTGLRNHLMVRKGSSQNVMVFPNSDYDNDAFSVSNNVYTFTHKAFGADMLRYSGNFGQNWTAWENWQDTTALNPSVFSGDFVFWDGNHVMVQSALSSTHVVHADHGYSQARRVPQLLARGPFNQWGFDQGISAQMEQNADGKWELEIMSTWPAYVQLNVWGYDDYYYGDVDGDGVLDRLPLNTQAPNYVNMSAPPHRHLAWALLIDDSTMTWSLVPRGESAVGAIMYALLLSIPLVTGVLAVVLFNWSFYGIRYNKWGVKPKVNHSYSIICLGNKLKTNVSDSGVWTHKHKRRKVLTATLEYEIIDWKLKVKIGGLGVMSSLMGKAMTDVDLVRVIPKVKDIEYPPGDPAEPIEVIIFGEPYLIEVETHVLDNITYVILDSLVFRAQTKADPYPSRMDDLSSAIFYSTWNQAIRVFQNWLHMHIAQIYGEARIHIW
ncbi:hypothetical protein EUX98_g3423 [Antrodiella citrinella]|uniref:Uncharacterized protein n=1 Tax=Antrodiella citrinella TaxID=2447956 RepID=A0A4S4MZ22_9APHY|nr:hypothetical protein EUX98_g3423 [Antrodiella citrinella]